MQRQHNTSAAGLQCAQIFAEAKAKFPAATLTALFATTPEPAHATFQEVLGNSILQPLWPPRTMWALPPAGFMPRRQRMHQRSPPLAGPSTRPGGPACIGSLSAGGGPLPCPPPPNQETKKLIREMKLLETPSFPVVSPRSSHPSTSASCLAPDCTPQVLKTVPAPNQALPLERVDDSTGRGSQAEQAAHTPRGWAGWERSSALGSCWGNRWARDWQLDCSWEGRWAEDSYWARHWERSLVLG